MKLLSELHKDKDSCKAIFEELCKGKMEDIKYISGYTEMKGIDNDMHPNTVQLTVWDDGYIFFEMLVYHQGWRDEGFNNFNIVNFIQSLGYTNKI